METGTARLAVPTGALAEEGPVRWVVWGGRMQTTSGYPIRLYVSEAYRVKRFWRAPRRRENAKAKPKTQKSAPRTADVSGLNSTHRKR